MEDAVLYAVRSGCRIWLSDVRGAVGNTHIFKDGISSGVREIPILRPSKSTVNPNAERQFGRLLIYRDKQLVTYNTTTLFVLDPQMNQVVACQNQLGGIVGVAVHGNEVFVLRRHTEDAVIRIADDPEMVCHKGETKRKKMKEGKSWGRDIYVYDAVHLALDNRQGSISDQRGSQKVILEIHLNLLSKIGGGGFLTKYSRFM